MTANSVAAGESIDWAERREQLYEELLRIMCDCLACRKASLDERPICRCRSCREMRRLADKRLGSDFHRSYAGTKPEPDAIAAALPDGTGEGS